MKGKDTPSTLLAFLYDGEKPKYWLHNMEVVFFFCFFFFFVKTMESFT